MNPGFSVADSQCLEDSQPMKNQDSFSPTLWFIWAQFWNQWTKCSQDQLEFWVLPIFHPCGLRGQPCVVYPRVSYETTFLSIIGSFYIVLFKNIQRMFKFCFVFHEIRLTRPSNIEYSTKMFSFLLFSFDFVSIIFSTPFQITNMKNIWKISSQWCLLLKWLG